MVRLVNDDPYWLLDPFKLLARGWPHVQLADYQANILSRMSGFRPDGTRWAIHGDKIVVVPAANMLGKDFLAAYISLWFFASRIPARVVTTSVDNDQLNGVLWGEMRDWLEKCEFDLGLKYNHMQIRQYRKDGTLVGKSELVGKTAQRGSKEGLLGRHMPWAFDGRVPAALFVGDEASGLEDCHVEAAETWAHQMLFIGNCYPTENFFRKYAEAGDVDEPGETNPQAPKAVKVIHISAEQSPNVRLGLREKALGLEPSFTQVIPGCMSYKAYLYRRANWSEDRQTVGLDAQWYEGDLIKLFPPDWIQMCVEYAAYLSETIGRRTLGTSMGCDPGEGGDPTCWTIFDKYGIIDQVEKKTPNTTDVYQDSITLGEQFSIPSEYWGFDAGGGGKQAVDTLTLKGYRPSAIRFGSAPLPFPRVGKGKPVDVKAIYKNRRAQLYGDFRAAMDPNAASVETEVVSARQVRNIKAKTDYEHPPVLAIPGHLTNLLEQMKPIPLSRDAEGVLFLIPKSKPTATYKGPTLKKLCKRSPDNLDSATLGLHMSLYPLRPRKPVFA